MLARYLVGVAGVTGAALLWLAVQQLWRAAFPGLAPGGDALAGRSDCHGCGSCTHGCETGAAASAGASREERR